MSQVELLTRAIGRLEMLKAETGYFEMNGWLIELVTTGTECNPRQEPVPLTDDPLITTLYRTLDAQLEILTEARDQTMGRERLCLPLNTGGQTRAFTLARAVLGDDV